MKLDLSIIYTLKKPEWSEALYVRVSLMAKMIKNRPAVQETQVQSSGREDPLEKERLPSPVFLPGEPHRQRSLAGCSPQGRQESDMTERLNMHAYM